jgi:hypothetical protein
MFAIAAMTERIGQQGLKWFGRSRDKEGLLTLLING